MKMYNLLECFKEAKRMDSKFFGVAVKNGEAEAEIIINPRSNFDNKESYYQNAYNEELELKTYDKIRIIAVAHGNSFEEIEHKLLG